ncbi:MAG: hypothetical protein Q8908_10355 [Bacteroidota bacterium]|nr:hypothetical protein [Bacteroidota bacterium]
MIYPAKTRFTVFILLAILLSNNGFCQRVKADKPSDVQETGSKIIRINKVINYPDNRPPVRYYVNAIDVGVIFKHGTGPDSCDVYGARDAWLWENQRTFYLHYDGAGPKGWLSCLAVSEDLQNWKAKGPILKLGDRGSDDQASASYGTVYHDKNKWHLFYLGTPNTTPAPDRVPAFPYLTMKAESNSPAGPWKKRYDITPFKPKPGSYYSATASPGQVIKFGKSYLMFFSASTDKPILRTIGIARTNNLDSTWTPDPHPILPLEEQIENTSLYFENTSNTWFLFTNHVGIKDGFEYTDAIWIYWTKDLNKWDPKNKAIVFDSKNCKWSKHIIGLPTVLKVDGKLVMLYDGNRSPVLLTGAKSHMNRDIGMAWLRLPLITPTL